MRILNSCVAGLPIWLFLTPLAVFGNKKNRKICFVLAAYFQSDRLRSGKTFPERHIHY